VSLIFLAPSLYSIYVTASCLIESWGNFRYPPELPPIYNYPPRYEKTLTYPPIFQILSLRTILVVICPNYPSLQNYAVLGKPKTMSFCPKRRSFGHFRVFFFFFFFLKKEIKKIKKKKKIAGWGNRGVASATPYRPYGGGLCLWGGPATPKGHQEKKKKKNRKNGFELLGVAGPPPTGGGRPPPPGPWGWSGHPQNPKPIAQSLFFFFFFFFGLSGWPDHPQRPGGGFSHPHTAGMGWPATPWPKMGWSGHPIFWARGGSSHPDFFPPPPPPPFFFFFFISKP
jgi:hypothetical protein